MAVSQTFFCMSKAMPISAALEKSVTARPVSFMAG
jgi:hypothetical protein